MPVDIPCVAYIRMSNEDQKTSPSQQRKQIENYAKRNGFGIVQWYKDEGKSGSKDTEKRTEFLKMLADADGGDFTIILCLDLSRFGRLDSIEGAIAKKALRDAGVKLCTVLEGEIDWTTSTGRIVDVVLSEAQHDYSVRLGQKTLQGKLDAFLAGKMFGSKVPYGYARKITDFQGVERVVSRKEEFAKPKGWKGELIEGDADEVRVVRWLYTTFASRDVGFRWLAAELNKEGTPSPTGIRWCSKVVEDILSNGRYVGDTTLGKKLAGNFWRLAGEEVERVNGSKAVDRTQKPLLLRNTHVPLIERAVWDAVQQKIARRKAAYSHTKGSGGYVLKDVLYCGECSKRLYGNPNKGHKKSGRVKYVCKSAIKYGKQCECGQWGVHEDEVLPFLKRKLVEEIDKKVLLDSEAVRELKQAEPSGTGGLQSKLDALDRKIDQGTERFLTAPPELTADVAKKLTEWKRERQQLQERLGEVQQTGTQRDGWRAIVEFMRDNKDDLLSLRTYTTADGKYSSSVKVRKDAFRELLVSNGCRMDFWWKRGSKNRWDVAKVRLRLFGNDAHLLEPSPH